MGFRQLPDYNLWTRLLNRYDIHILEEVLVQHRRCDRTNGNTSAPVVANSVRDVNESLYTLLHYFDEMPDELFVKAFASEFRKKDAQTKEELLCEKFFLMYDEKYYMSQIARFAAFLFIHDYYDILRVVLQNQYGFTLQDVHSLGQSFDLLDLRAERVDVPRNVRLAPNIIKRLLRVWKGK